MEITSGSGNIVAGLARLQGTVKSRTISEVLPRVATPATGFESGAGLNWNLVGRQAESRVQ